MGYFIKRDILKKLSDTQYLVFNFLEAPVLAFLLAFIVRYYDSDISNEFGYTLLENSNLPVYIFMSVIVAIFMGLTVSAEEIIKDRKILKREAFLNLSWSGYLLSKVTVQFIMSAIQAFTFVIIGNTIMEIRGMYFEYWLVLFSAWAMANVMGLLISDSFKTVVTIYILIPFLVIPQIILSGIIVKYENLNPQISSPKRIPFYGEIITARWAYEGLATYQFVNNDYQTNFYQWNKLKSNANLKANFHLKELINKLTFVERNLDNPDEADQVKYNLEALRREIRDEYQDRMIIHEYYDAAPTFSMKYVAYVTQRVRDHNIALVEQGSEPGQELEAIEPEEPEIEAAEPEPTAEIPVIKEPEPEPAMIEIEETAVSAVEASAVAKVSEPGPELETIKTKEPEIEAIEEKASAQPTESDALEEMRNHLKRKRSDHDTRLTFSRALCAAGEIKEAMKNYGTLIKSGAKMEEIYQDLQTYLETHPKDSEVLRTLGDAYMKDGDLERALEIYNEAMSIL